MVVIVDVVAVAVVLVVLLVVVVLVVVALLVDDVEVVMVVVALMVIVGLLVVVAGVVSVLVVEVLLAAVGAVVTATVVGEREVVEEVDGMSVVDWVEAFCWGPITTKETVATARIIKMTVAAPAVMPFMYVLFRGRCPNTLTQACARTILRVHP